MNEVTSVEKTTKENNLVYWHAFQAFYHKLTGKKETLKKVYHTSFQISLNDIEDLHYKILQAAGGYQGRLVGQSHNIEVAYVDKSKATYSTFDRFKVQADTGATATNSVSLEYHFSFKDRGPEEISNYKLTIDLISGIAVFKEAQEEVPKFIWRRTGIPIGFSTIEFIDYTIAQNFSGIVSNWFECLKKTPKRKLLDWIQDHSYQIPQISRVLFLLLAALACARVADRFVSPQDVLSGVHFFSYCERNSISVCRDWRPDWRYD